MMNCIYNEVNSVPRRSAVAQIQANKSVSCIKAIEMQISRDLGMSEIEFFYDYYNYLSLISLDRAYSERCHASGGVIYYSMTVTSEIFL